MPRIEIINGDHTPPQPFMIVANYGLHVDFSNVRGELWDPTVAKIEWGLTDPSGKTYGRVLLKNGQGRSFYDQQALQPYLAAYAERQIEERAKHEANMAAAARRQEAQRG